MDCEEFKMIRRPHIIIRCISVEIHLEKSDDNNEPEDENRKYITDVFKAFQDVKFTVIDFRGEISIE